MAVKRYAGSSNVVDDILAAVGDNAYTRAWSDAMGNAIRPVDRMIASDSDRFASSLKEMEGLINRGVEEAKGQGLSQAAGEQLLARLNRLDPSGALAENMGAGLSQAVERAKRNGSSVGSEFAGLVFDAREDLKPELIDAYLKQHPPSDVHMMTKAGGLLHAAAGMAPSAYGIPAAGAGLAAWGLHDYLQAQQQAEKESQLPMS